ARHHKSVAAILDPLTGAVADKGNRATAFPWRNHLCDIQWYIGLPIGASGQQVNDAHDWINGSHRAIADWSVGAYVNYLEPGHKLGRYYGPNLARLKRIKAQVDPHDFFHSPYTV